jgi:hypothetical protein
MRLYCRNIFLIVLLFAVSNGFTQERDRDTPKLSDISDSVEDDFIPQQEAMVLFNKYKPVIENKNNAIVDNPTPVSGDINGDGKDDCIISYVLIAKDGGNAIINGKVVVYLLTDDNRHITDEKGQQKKVLVDGKKLIIKGFID